MTIKEEKEGGHKHKKEEEKEEDLKHEEIAWLTDWFFGGTKNRLWAVVECFVILKLA